MKRITLSILIAVSVLGFSTRTYCQKDKEVREKPEKTEKGERDKTKDDRSSKDKEPPERGSGGGAKP